MTSPESVRAPHVTEVILRLPEECRLFFGDDRLTDPVDVEVLETVFPEV